jgi:hypothetical protein
MTSGGGTPYSSALGIRVCVQHNPPSPRRRERPADISLDGPAVGDALATVGAWILADVKLDLFLATIGAVALRHAGP